MPSRLPVVAPSNKPKLSSQKPERSKYANSASDLSQTGLATPSIDLNKPIIRRPRLLSREAFDAIRLKAKEVDEASLKQLQEFPDPEDSDTAITIVERVNQHRRPLSSLLISTSFHLILFLLLTVLIKQDEPKKASIMLDAAIAIADPLDKNPVDQRDDQTIKIEIPEESQSPVDMTFDATAIAEDPKASEPETTVPSPLAVEPSPTVTVDQVTNPVGALPIKPSGGGLEGRDGETRGQLAARMGGSAESEAAVENGLAWIINHQMPDGSWQLKHDHNGRCNGQCPDEGAIESTTAATGLALMALLGAGYTHKSGPYQEEVEAGLRYLVSSMRMTIRGGHMVRGERGMYSHAIATIALAEAFTMTEDSWLVEPTAAARLYIENAQHKKGGWRYNPGNAGDMTVTGWQIMALKSCQLGKAITPPRIWVDAESFVDSLRTSSGYYGYYQNPEERPTTTAVAALVKMYLGAGLDNADVDMAASYVAGMGPSESDIYYNYYGTQVLFHRGGKDWKQWNETLRDHLIQTQDRSGTHRNGSWYFEDPNGRFGGRLYTTAMAIMTLEVYYRYMPLYRRDAVEMPTDDQEDQ